MLHRALDRLFERHPTAGLLPCCCFALAVGLQGLDRLFEGHPTLLLYTVMVCCPLLMNLCQVRFSFWGVVIVCQACFFAV